MLSFNHITVVFSFMFITATFPSHADYLLPGKGRVDMQGAIIDPACTIAVESRDQTIVMDVISVEDIIRDGQGRSKSFVIKLVDCELARPKPSLSGWTKFQVTFDGDAEKSGFGVRGAASGVSLQINDVIGNVAAPGKPLPLDNITKGNLTLNYSIKLVANNQAVKSGDYFSSIRFKLDYF